MRQGMKGHMVALAPILQAAAAGQQGGAAAACRCLEPGAARHPARLQLAFRACRHPWGGLQ